MFPRPPILKHHSAGHCHHNQAFLGVSPSGWNEEQALERSHQPKAVTCPCSASLPLPHHGTKLQGLLIHSFIQLFSGPQETKQILTRYKVEARKNTDVGLGKRWRSCCVKKVILGVGTGGQSLCKVVPEHRG